MVRSAGQDGAYLPGGGRAVKRQRHPIPGLNHPHEDPGMRFRSSDYAMWRDGPFCYWCGCLLVTDKRLKANNGKRDATVDHLLPAVYGGTLATDNVVLACPRCNSTRGTEPIHSTLAKLEGIWIAKGMRRVMGYIEFVNSKRNIRKRKISRRPVSTDVILSASARSLVERQDEGSGPPRCGDRESVAVGGGFSANEAAL